MAESPLFASSREALSFAANFGGRGVESPVMNRMLSEMQKADQEAQQVERRQAVPAMQGLSQLDRAGQAGLILQLTGRLPDETLHFLLAAVLRPRNACNCRQPCCSGFRPNKDWRSAILYIDESVYTFQVQQKPSGKCFITPTRMRLELICQYFDRASKLTQEALAERFEVTEQTIAQHQKVVGKHLTGMVKSGFSQLDIILVEAGIVGALE